MVTAYIYSVQNELVTVVVAGLPTRPEEDGERACVCAWVDDIRPR